MDLLSSNTMNVTHLALNGLMERQKAIGANIANAETPGYQRKEVSFENQLSEIIQKSELKEYIKSNNSIKHVPTSIEQAMGSSFANEENQKGLTTQEKAYLNSDISSGFQPQVMDDIFAEGTSDGNNVELEKEMMDLTRVGTKYVLLTNLQKKSYMGLSEVIKGTGQ